jgi:hypothetical protein
MTQHTDAWWRAEWLRLITIDHPGILTSDGDMIGPCREYSAKVIEQLEAHGLIEEASYIHPVAYCHRVTPAGRRLLNDVVSQRINREN